MIKFFGAKVLHDVVDRALQMHGGLGYSTDMPLEMLYRYARHARFVDGADEVHRESVARHDPARLRGARGRDPDRARPDPARGRAGQVRRRAGAGRASRAERCAPSSSSSGRRSPSCVRCPSRSRGPARCSLKIDRRGALPLRPPHHGVAGGDAAVVGPVHARSRGGRNGRGARRAASTGSRSASRSSSAPRGAAARACNCRQGLENRCVERPELPGGGIGLDGALAEYLLVPSPAAARLERGARPRRRGAADRRGADAVPRDQAEPATCSRPGSTTVVIGVGGLGHMAVQLLRALTPTRIVAHRRARVAPCARPRGRRRRGVRSRRPRPCRRCGASSAATARRSSSTSSASTQTLALGASLLGPGGHLTLIGLGGGDFPMARGSRSSGR